MYNLKAQVVFSFRFSDITQELFRELSKGSESLDVYSATAKESSSNQGNSKGVVDRERGGGMYA